VEKTNFLAYSKGNGEAHHVRDNIKGFAGRYIFVRG
jgi:hypothetical protein